MSLEDFNDWLSDQFPDLRKREWAKDLIINYLKTLDEHTLNHNLASYNYKEIYNEALYNLKLI